MFLDASIFGDALYSQNHFAPVVEVTVSLILTHASQDMTAVSSVTIPSLNLCPVAKLFSKSVPTLLSR
jgi:hypothetical protein